VLEYRAKGDQNTELNTNRGCQKTELNTIGVVRKQRSICTNRDCQKTGPHWVAER
jgi:hypothetical protein